MGERSSYAHGTFCWTDLSTTDPEGAKSFYTALFGWEPDDMPAGDDAIYTMLRVEGRDAAALSAQREDQRAQGVPPNWLSYVAVDDVDSVAPRVGELGGMLFMGPFDVLDAGRMALVADPTGAVFSLWQANRHIGSRVVNEPGAMSLNQLNSSDPELAADFYRELLSWEISKQDTGGASDYWGSSTRERWPAA